MALFAKSSIFISENCLSFQESIHADFRIPLFIMRKNLRRTHFGRPGSNHSLPFMRVQANRKNSIRHRTHSHVKLARYSVRISLLHCSCLRRGRRMLPPRQVRRSFMTKAIIVRETGGPDVLRLEEVDPGLPQQGEVRIRQQAIGINFIDCYFRRGVYKPPSLPFIPGQEACGFIEEIGPNVTDFKTGDRVAYATQTFGAYSESRVLPAAKCVPIPNDIDFPAAAALLLKGMTARYLVRQTYEVRKGDTVLFHAAAGGVGLIACQWLRHLGAMVIGTVGDDAKVDCARANGCDHVINYRTENFVERVLEITGGTGVCVVYDSVGKDTFSGSLDCLQSRGLLVSFGQSSGVVPPFDILQLGAKGSLFITRPILSAYTSTPAELRENAANLFDMVESGAIKITINQIYPLAEAVRAHQDLESRKTIGSSVLIP
jgi:NADPH2:quinone reductase